MAAHETMSLSMDRILSPAEGRPECLSRTEAGRKLEVAVIFTAVESTITALKHAAFLASSLGARISLVVPHVVPYPLPLNEPPVALDFAERRFRVIAEHSRVETRVAVYLGRDRLQTLRAVLKPDSIVVIGGRKTWWPSAEKRLARGLRRAGHEVILSEKE